MRRQVLAAAALLSSSPAVAQQAQRLERSPTGPEALRLADRHARDFDLDLLIEAGRDESDARPPRPATFGINLVALGHLADSVRIGSGVGYHRSAAPASLRAATASGAATEFLLVPGMVMVPVVMKVSLASGIETVLEPALAVGWVSGSLYRTGTTRLDYDSRPGLGAQISAGLELRLSGPASLSLRAGVRALRPSLVCTRAFVAQGPPQQLAHPEPVDVDLSGPFWNVGLSFRL